MTYTHAIKELEKGHLLKWYVRLQLWVPQSVWPKTRLLEQGDDGGASHRQRLLKNATTSVCRPVRHRNHPTASSITILVTLIPMTLTVCDSRA